MKEKPTNPTEIREKILTEAMFRQMATLRRTMNEMARLGIDLPEEISPENFKSIQNQLNDVKITTKQLERR